MAKYKSNGISHKQFFGITVLGFLALGLILIANASLKPTNTQSDASGCNHAPTITFVSSEPHPDYVVYKLKLKNNDEEINGCLATRDFTLTKDIPQGWNAEFININNNPVTRLVNIGMGETKRFEFWVRPPSRASAETYSLSIKAKEELPPYLSDVKYLKYSKD